MNELRGNFYIGCSTLMPVLRLFFWYSAIYCANCFMARWVPIGSNFWYSINCRHRVEWHWKITNMAERMTQPTSRLVAWTLYVSFAVDLNKLLDKQSRCCWFGMLCQSYDVTVMICPTMANQYNLICNEKVAELFTVGTIQLPNVYSLKLK